MGLDIPCQARGHGPNCRRRHVVVGQNSRHCSQSPAIALIEAEASVCDLRPKRRCVMLDWLSSRNAEMKLLNPSVCVDSVAMGGGPDRAKDVGR